MIDKSEKIKYPRLIFEKLSAFPPNRETLGGTAYFIVEKAGNILIDCPAWNETNQQFLLEQGGVSTLVLTHRGGISNAIKPIQTLFNCQVLIQEQEAYLLPQLQVITFEHDFSLGSSCTVFWTPGHSPGSSCLYWNCHGGVLLTGRHLLPNQQGKPMPLRGAKTFHWFRQLRSVAWLRDRFSAETLCYLCPGANTGFLRGQGMIDHAYRQLLDLDLEMLRHSPAC